MRIADFILRLLPVVFLVSSIVLPAMPVSADGTRPEAGWSGTWHTRWTIMEYGTINSYEFDMVFTQSGSQVTGTSDYYGWQLTGTTSGNKLTGTWSNTWNNAQQHPHIAGQIDFTLSSSGTSFSGLFKGEYHYQWDDRFTVTGTRSGSVTPQPVIPTPIQPPYIPPSDIQPETITPTPSQIPDVTPIPPFPGIPVIPTPCTFTGVWDTDFGDLTLEQDGSNLTGSYTYQGGKIVGTVDGLTATGTWSEADTYQPPKDAGDFIFTIQPGCKTIEGQWGYGSCDWDGDIMGTRAGQPIPPPPPVPPTPIPPTPTPIPPTPTPVSGPWAGTWSTRWGEMVLSQSGNQVTGTYIHDSGKIIGTVSGDTLQGWWSESPDYSPPKNAGEVELTMGPEHQTITGRWRYGSSGSWYENDWSGTRKGLLKIGFEAEPSSPCDWSGTWDFDWSYALQLTQSGNRVTGSYKPSGWNYTGYIDGTLSGSTLIGTWTEQDQTGRIEWTMSADCNSFTGRYNHSLSATSGWYPLHKAATRVGQPQPQPEPDNQPSPEPVNPSWEGTWNTDWGSMDITVSGATATGTYTTNNGKLDGKINGRYFSGTWSRSPSYSAPKDAGAFLFVMSEDGNSFKGDWKYSDCSWMGPWDGTLTGSDQIIPPANQKPIAQFTVIPQSPTTADTIIISNQSYDPDGDSLSYTWSIDGSQLTQYNNMAYCILPGQAAGYHSAALAVSDSKGGAATAQTQYFVDSAEPPQPTPPQPTPDTNRPPTAYFTVTPQSPQTTSNIVASSQSTDPDGDMLTYAWTIDGMAMTQYANQPYCIYQNPPVGTHTIGLQVADSNGAFNFYQTQISVTQAPQPSPGPQPVPGANNPPKAAFTFDPPQPQVGQTIQVISQSTDADGDKLSYSWYLDGDLLSQYTGQSQWKWKIPSGGHVMQLEVQDGRGGKDTVSRKIKGSDADDSQKKWKIGPFSCFIATAAYGSPTAAELDTLRSFRDHVLIKSEPGRWAVDTYYHLSPPLAEYIATHETVRTLVREQLLDPIVGMLKDTRSLWDRDYDYSR